MSKAVANLTQSTETITFSAQDNGETISVNITEAARGPNSVTIATASDGTANLSLNSLTFNNAPVAPVTTPGSLSWNDQEGTLDLKMKGGNVTLQVGQEMVVRVVNKTGDNLTEAGYKVVRIRKASEGGAQGQRLAVVLAQGDGEFESTDVIGVVTEDIAVNQEGFVTTFGTVNGINTTGSLYGETWSDGDLLFLSPTTPGGLTKVKPSAPDHLVIVGYVQYAHPVNGKIFVKTETSYELDELHNVAISDPQTGEVLAYNGTTGLWENTEISTSITTSTPTNLTGYIYGDGTNVAGATAATDLSTGSTLMARAADGSTAVEYLNVGTFTGGSPVGGYGMFTTDPTGFSGAEVSGSPSLRVGNGTHSLSFTSSGAAFDSGTITTSQPLSLTQTWSTTATYKAIDVNVTDSGPSNAASLLMDLRVGGVSVASIQKNGRISISGVSDQMGFQIGPRINLSGNGTETFCIRTGALFTRRFQVDSNCARADTLGVGVDVSDTLLTRDAAGVLSQRNGANAQVTRVYDTYTSATDYHRLAIATARATATAMSGATVTLTNIIPAGAVVVGVTCKVTTAITGATSFDIGTATDVDRFGAAIAVALGTTSDNRNWTAGTIECFPTATSLILTANGSNFTAGAVYVSVQYLSGQAD